MSAAEAELRSLGHNKTNTLVLTFLSMKGRRRRRIIGRNEKVESRDKTNGWCANLCFSLDCIPKARNLLPSTAKRRARSRRPYSGERLRLSCAVLPRKSPFYSPARRIHRGPHHAAGV